jgi:hypothetical protein
MDRIDHSLVLVPESMNELDDLERSRHYLTSVGCALELWEIQLLVQSGAWDLRTRTAKTPDGPAATPAQALRALRETEGAFVRDVRLLLEGLAPSAEVARAQLVIAAITASRRNREAVKRWIADPSRHRPEAEKRIASLSWRAGKLMEQLERLRAAAWESSVRDDPGPGRASGNAGPIPFSGPLPPLHPRMLADLRRVHRASYVLREYLYHRVEPWELLLMISGEGEPIRGKLDSLLVGERTKQWERLEELALGLVGRSVGVRREWASKVQELRSYLQGVTGTQGTTLTVGIEIVLAAPAGRRRVSRWLDSPVEHASEATSYMSAVFSIAARHADELEPATKIIVTNTVA